MEFLRGCVACEACCRCQQLRAKIVQESAFFLEKCSLLTADNVLCGTGTLVSNYKQSPDKDRPDFEMLLSL